MKRSRGPQCWPPRAMQNGEYPSIAVSRYLDERGGTAQIHFRTED
jgi:hypothetical protein